MMKEMGEREILWEELKAFCAYIDSYFPRIERVFLFGSMLWKEIPRDIDVYVAGDSTYLGESHKRIFPHICLFKEVPEETNTTLIWDRGAGGTVVDTMPVMNRETMIKEMRFLRQQIKELVKEVEAHSHTKCHPNETERAGFFDRGFFKWRLS